MGEVLRCRLTGLMPLQLPIGGIPFPSVLACARVGALMIWPDQPQKMLRKREGELWARATREVYRDTVVADLPVSAAALDELRRAGARSRTVERTAADDAARARL